MEVKLHLWLPAAASAPPPAALTLLLRLIHQPAPTARFVPAALAAFCSFADILTGRMVRVGSHHGAAP